MKTPSLFMKWPARVRLMALPCITCTLLAGPNSWSNEINHVGWSVVIHENGREVSRQAVPQSNILFSEIDALSKRCRESARPDRTSYSPYVRVESDFVRIDLRSKSVVYSTRSSVDKPWQQTSLKASTDDQKLRKKLIDFAAIPKLPVR